MGGCPNKVPEGQFTVAKGTVTNLRTGRPLPGVRMAIVSAIGTLKNYQSLSDTVLTDAQGQYELSFTNSKGLFYAIDCGQLGAYYPFQQTRLDFSDSVSITGGGSHPSQATRELVLGRTNVFDFRPSPRRVWQVQVNTLTTGYQNFYFAQKYFIASGGPADNQHRLVTIYQSVPFAMTAPQDFYRTPGVLPVAHFTRSAPGTTQDTLVQLMPTTSLTGDTVKATLKFGH
ncbi:hypothetical protein A0257_01950 [Hymenobacter psoromatis]|nr:hypothetical protein A0257_01950 [Hymenobacter psoromatis]